MFLESGKAAHMQAAWDVPEEVMKSLDALTKSADHFDFTDSDSISNSDVLISVHRVPFRARRTMKTLITEFISLDGVVQAPGAPEEDTGGGFQHGGWSRKLFDPEAMGGSYDELAKSSDALLQGRRTYQVSAAAWPNRSGEGFTDWINSTPKVRRLRHRYR